MSGNTHYFNMRLNDLIKYARLYDWNIEFTIPSDGACGTLKHILRDLNIYYFLASYDANAAIHNRYYYYMENEFGMSVKDVMMKYRCDKEKYVYIDLVYYIATIFNDRDILHNPFNYKDIEYTDDSSCIVIRNIENSNYSCIEFSRLSNNYINLLKLKGNKHHIDSIVINVNEIEDELESSPFEYDVGEYD